jgi:uncharacterized membrane protein YdbT with pleckstrin-like domain
MTGAPSNLSAFSSILLTAIHFTARYRRFMKYFAALQKIQAVTFLVLTQVWIFLPATQLFHYSGFELPRENSFSLIGFSKHSCWLCCSEIAYQFLGAPC